MGSIDQRKKKISGYRFTTTEKMTKLNEFVLTSAPVVNLVSDPIYSDSFVELVGWYWSEGTDVWNSDGIQISQNAGVQSDLIRSAAVACFGSPVDGKLHRFDKKARWRDWRPHSSTPTCGYFTFNATAGRMLKKVAPNKVISPDFICSLTRGQLLSLISVSIKADGYERVRGGYRERLIVQNRKDRLDSLQMACQLAGISSNMRHDRTGERWVLSIYERNKIWPGQRISVDKREAISYTGTVWCPKTKNKTWLARRNGTVYFTGNTFPLVNEDWRIAIEMLGAAILDKQVAEKRMDVLVSGNRVAEVEFKSAERSDEGLRGAGLDVALLDEASRIPREAWEYGVRPALSDRLGKAVFISTPKGRNWFHEIWRLGQGGEDPDWKSWKFPSNSNPYFPADEWLKLKQTQPSIIFSQEYEAEFLEDNTSVFRGLDGISGAGPRSAREGERYVIGVDLARTVDFTVIAVMTMTGEVVYLNRSKELSWPTQKRMIEVVFNRYQPGRIVMDSSGVGDPIEQDLRKGGIPVTGLKMNSVVVKKELVEGLMIAVEQNLITIPAESRYPDARWLWEELRSYGATPLPSGHLRYEAPPGYHDDGVSALMLCVHGCGNQLGRPVPKGKEDDLHPTTYGEYDAMTDPKRRRVRYFGSRRLSPAIFVRPR